ncbi:MAG: IS1096 element passenger TnpR family protein [Dissulfuribacterales bacterium]
MKIYQFRVSIIGIPNLYRIIEVSGNCTFDDFHHTIFQAFDRYDHHLYSFFITRKDTKNRRSIYDSPEITHPGNVEDIFYINYCLKKHFTLHLRQSNNGSAS